MNKVALTGRFTKDPNIRYSAGEEQMCVAMFTLAVDRKFKREGEPSADFITCKAFKKTAEFIEKYFHKGMKADITGRIQTGSYKDKEDRTVYTTEVIVEDIEFGESKSAQNMNGTVVEGNTKTDEWTDVDISGLPFNDNLDV